MKNRAHDVKQYWENRALMDPGPQSTTMDYWLRQIEANFLKEFVEKHKLKNVCDLGCGDGLTTISCARVSPKANFIGIDYSESMIGNAKRNSNDHRVDNLEFRVGDVTENLNLQNVDLIYTTRCLINIPDWQQQQLAISNIHEALARGGTYIMIENFHEGHDLFNSIRTAFGLSEIPIRSHNNYFYTDKLITYISTFFEVINQINISSSYYLVSRIIYSSLCKRDGISPDYHDPHHELAANLPFVGEFGPVRAIVLKKR